MPPRAISADSGTPGTGETSRAVSFPNCMQRRAAKAREITSRIFILSHHSLKLSICINRYFFCIPLSVFVKDKYIKNLKPGKQEWASVRHLWREKEKEQQRETSMSFQAPSHGLQECWWAPGVWGNVLSPGPTHTHWSSPSHWSRDNDGRLPWPTENGAVKVSEWL